ncbi:hypothetical protein [Clostridium sp.]|jgi:hypothetical protein|uniref:hypothetical protein n=1 Tax=Clostridium sp. TaxID=1506 RepID=UPI003EE969E8
MQEKSKDQPTYEDIERAREIMKQTKLSPAQRQIIALPTDLLLKNYALIIYKASSLSSKKRDMVKERVSYKLSKELITVEDIEKEVNSLRDYVETKLKEQLDDSIDK